MNTAMAHSAPVSPGATWFPTDKCFIAGRWVAPLSGETLPVEDPSRGVAIGSDAAAIANGTGYGLVAGVWTADGGRQMRLARALRAGQVFLNTYGAGGGVELPFGGVGKSGHGREKGLEALYGFSALKTVAAWRG